MRYVCRNKTAKKVVHRWIGSYLFVLLIPVLMSSYIGYQVNQVLLSEAEKSNMLFIDRFRQIIDKTNIDMDEVFFKTSSNPHLSKLVRREGTLDGEGIYDVLNLSEDMSGYRFNREDIIDYYVYIKGIDSVVLAKSTDGNMLNSAYYYRYSEEKYWTEDEWLNCMKVPTGKRIIKQYNENEQRYYLFFIRSTKVLHNQYYASICVRLDISSLLSQTIGDGDIMIMDEGNNIIFSTNNVKFSDFSYDLMTGEYGSIELEENDWIISYIESDYEEWKYMYVLPKDIYMETRRAIGRVTFLVTSLSLIVSIMLVYYMAKKNFRPIQSIINLVREQNNDTQVMGNELVYIYDSVENIIQKKKALAYRQRESMRKEYFHKLFQGKDLIDVAGERKSNLDICFQSEDFAVAVIYIDRYDGIVDGDKDDTSFIQLIIMNVLEESVKKLYLSYFFELDGLFYCVLNRREGTTFSDETLDFTEMLNEGLVFLNQKYGIYITIGISNWHEGVGGIQCGYSEALEVIEYKYVLGDHVLIYDEIIKPRKSNLYYLPVEYDKVLLTAVKKGNYEKCCNIIEDIFMRNFHVNTVVPGTAKLLVFELVTTLIKAYKEIESDSQEVSNQTIQLQDIIYLVEIGEVKKKILNVLKVFCEYNKTVEGENHQLLKYDVESYIQEHYSDSMLNISTIADYFNLHPYYLSKIYKDEYKESILDTLTRVRVEKGKILLQKFSVEEVAHRVGYTNARTFTRNFKKYVGVTPGRYK